MGMLGTLSANKLGGASLIIGSILAIVFSLITPGAFSADPSSGAEVITALAGSSGLAKVCALLVTLGIVHVLFGVIVIQGNVKDGDGSALTRFGALTILIAITLGVVGNSLVAVMAGADLMDPASMGAVGAVFAANQGINIIGGSLAGLGFFLFALGLSTRDGYNQMAAYLAALAGIVSLVCVLIGGLASETAQVMGIIVGICWIVTTLWAVILGLDLLKQE